ncbi:hexose kinase [Corynebacterium poyangense]|uniref:Hexose kinase n=1 Tax=Corynebacterium poyangense TaxID=2684405 RepID=A0A7H0SPA3_9CORY|nr:1-phosphofructokinase family hexose kinase [Corynebacterium poyangense]MBZ8177952.1 hexose kinase [Corynebacterium poyangense]QNQ90378.1 hexose kinase [Corynebacterium poyangense]
MIVTLTLNPSIDATLALAEPLERGSVHRLDSATRVAGGKGINVSNAIHRAQSQTLAIFPSSIDDLFISLLKETQIPYRSFPINEAIRTNTTVTEPDGKTTKLNGPGPRLTPEEIDGLVELTLAEAQQAQWIILAGSLPPGCPEDLYSHVIRKLRSQQPDLKIAVDTSDAAMVALGQNLSDACPDLIKPNGLELAQLSGNHGESFEEAAARREFSGILAAAQELQQRGIPEILVTLGASGAVLVTQDGAWHASPPPITVVSTVGAGDCSLAGYVLSRSRGADYPQCLKNAVAYGSAATALPGTTIPSPELIHPEAVQLTHLKTHP